MDDSWIALALCRQRELPHSIFIDLLRRGWRLSDIWGGSPPVGLPVPDSPAGFAEKMATIRDRADASIASLQRQLEDIPAHVLPFGHALYPDLLSEIADPPLVLFVRGNPTALSLPQVAIVGSRHASRNGRKESFDTAAELSSGGFAITSGLAAGVDAAAHRGALEAGAVTVAIMGTGPDIIYPGDHRLLAKQILEGGGALASEFLPGTAPKKENFPRRNRIISGLSLAVLVVEAKFRSGSLITARLAAEQGRPVCVFPGGIRDALKKGCHRLIREGATLVQDTADILEAISDMRGMFESAAGSFELSSSAVPAADDEEDASASDSRVLQSMGANPCSFALLQELTGLPASRLLAELTELELSGLIYQSPEGYRRS